MVNLIHSYVCDFHDPQFSVKYGITRRKFVSSLPALVQQQCSTFDRYDFYGR